MGRRNKIRVQAIRTGQAPTYRRIARERDQDRWTETVLERAERVSRQFPGYGHIVGEVAAEMLKEGRLRQS